MNHRLTSSSKQHWGRSCTFITLSWQLNRPLCLKGNGDSVEGGGGPFHLFVHPCVSNDGEGDKQNRQNMCFVF